MASARFARQCTNIGADAVRVAFECCKIAIRAGQIDIALLDQRSKNLAPRIQLAFFRHGIGSTGIRIAFVRRLIRPTGIVLARAGVIPDRRALPWLEVGVESDRCAWPSVFISAEIDRPAVHV
ncbi:MAG: hypothetical protein MJE77_37465 [Proteobacteria bacterium]|nr:hypothetical protein [Pseudomonadota bacterium]